MTLKHRILAENRRGLLKAMLAEGRRIRAIECHNPLSGLIGGAEYFSVITPDGIPGTQGQSKLNPSTGTSTWTLQIADSYSLICCNRTPCRFQRHTVRSPEDVATSLPSGELVAYQTRPV